jgi:hypothetical protein
VPHGKEYTWMKKKPKTLKNVKGIENTVLEKLIMEKVHEYVLVMNAEDKFEKKLI